MNYNEQHQKHRDIMKALFKHYSIDSPLTNDKGILTDKKGTKYKVSIRQEHTPNFYLDNTTFNKLKNNEGNSFYIVSVKNSVYIFDVKNTKYPIEIQKCNYNTFESKKNKGSKKVRVIQKFTRSNYIDNLIIDTTENLIHLKKLTKNALFC